MSENEVKHTNNEGLEGATDFWNRSGKKIATAAAVILVVVGGWFGYQEYIVTPKEEKASEAMIKAQEYFALDSSNLVLNGDGVSKGVLYIIKNYDGTKAANIAGYYAGVSYLKLGDFNNAIKYLKDFSTDAKQIQMLAIGALGDASAELNKKDEAIDYYKKAAASFSEDESNASEYLFRAALLSETTGKNEAALALYKEIKEKYPTTDKGFLADKYIYRLCSEK